MNHLGTPIGGTMKSEGILKFWGCRGSIASPGVHTICLWW